MGINNFTQKLSLLCKACSTPGLDGLTSDFHDAGHGYLNMEVGAERVLSQSPESAPGKTGPKF